MRSRKVLALDSTARRIGSRRGIDVPQGKHTFPPKLRQCALIAPPGTVRMPFEQRCTPTAQSLAMAARVHSCSDSGLVDGSLSRSTSDFSSDSMQTGTPSSSNGSVLEMAERRDSSQQQVPLA